MTDIGLLESLRRSASTFCYRTSNLACAGWSSVGLDAKEKLRQASMSEKRTQTCDTCKIRHQKCDSIRPTCYHCKIRDMPCVYSSVSVKSRASGAASSSATSSRGTRTVSILNNASSDGTSRSSTEAVGLPKLSNGELRVREVLNAELVCVALFRSLGHTDLNSDAPSVGKHRTFYPADKCTGRINLSKGCSSSGLWHRLPY